MRARVVNQDRIPASKNNPVWDRCIAQPTYVPYEMILMNQNRRPAYHRGDITRPATCGDYYLGDGRWKHPDHPALDFFVFHGKSVTLPSPYVLAPMSIMVGGK